MKVGDLVWSKFYETYGIIVKDFGSSNHHCVVLIGDERCMVSKEKLEVVC